MFKTFSLFAVICVFSVIGIRNKKFNWNGCLITQAPTPFTKSGRLNIPMIKNLADYYAKNNITDLLLLEYDADGQTLRLKERKDIVRSWMEQACKYNFNIAVEIGLQQFVNTLELAKYINDLTCTCNKKVEAMTYYPEQIYKAQTVEEQMYEINMIKKVAPNIGLLFNDLTSTAPIISTADIILASCAMEQPILCGMETTIDTYLDIYAVDPKCKLEVFIFDIESYNRMTNHISVNPDKETCKGLETLSVETMLKVINTTRFKPKNEQYMFGAILLGLRSVSLGPNLSPRITKEIEAAAKACDRVKGKKLQNELNSWVTAITNSQNAPLNTYKRTYFSNMKAAFQMITGMDLGARVPFERTNSTEYEAIRARLEKLGVPLAEPA